MPKLILIITLICGSFSFCVESLAGSFAVRPITFGARQPGNAAVHYSRAFDLLKYPESKKLSKEISEIMENGWLHENIEIKNLDEVRSLAYERYE